MSTSVWATTALRFSYEGGTMPDQQLEANLLEVTSRIVTAHVSNNAVATTDLPRLIITVHQALTDLGEKPLSPAVPIKKSVRPDYIICIFSRSST